MISSRPIEWSPEALLALQLHRSFRGSPLLPNLKEFTWKGKPDTILSTTLFLPPTLKRISVRAGNDISWTQAFLSDFPKVSPEVEDIYINGFLRAKPLDIRPLLGCIHLRSLSIPEIGSTVESALKLAQLPRLERLSLFFVQPPASENPSPHRSSPCVFHRVTSLECNSAPEFLQASRFPVLQSISITEQFSVGIRGTLDALWKNCSPDILSEISIMCLRRGGLVSSLTLEDIQPAYNFRRLEIFTVMTAQWIWNDQELERMASTWSRLRRLSIYSTIPRMYEPRGFTLLGLVHLAKCCPRLSCLCIRLRKQDPPISLPDIPEDWSSNFRLQTISFSGAEIEESQYDTVAAFLSSLFPNLRRIKTLFTSDRFDCWERIEGLLHAFGAARAYTQRE